MATIDDLPIPRFSDMSDDELHSMLRDVRARRLLRPDPAVKAAAKPKSASAPKQLNMTEDQLLNLLASNPELAAKLLGGA